MTWRDFLSHIADNFTSLTFFTLRDLCHGGWPIGFGNLPINNVEMEYRKRGELSESSRDWVWVASGVRYKGIQSACSSALTVVAGKAERVVRKPQNRVSLRRLDSLAR